MLDWSTILISFSSITFIISVFLFFIWYFLKDKLYFVKYWFFSFFLYAIGLALMLISTNKPTSFSIIISNVFLFLAIFTNAYGTYKLLNIKFNKTLYVSFITATLLLCVFTLIISDTNYRIIIFAINQIIFFGIQLYQSHKSEVLSNKIYMTPFRVVLSMFLLLDSTRIIAAIIFANNTVQDHSRFDNLAVMIYMVLIVGYGYSMFMVIYGKYEKEFLNITFKYQKAKVIQEAIEESEYKYETLFNSIPLALSIQQVIFDHNHKAIDIIVRKVNKYFELHTGLKPESILNVKQTEFNANLEPFWLQRYGYVLKSKKSISFIEYATYVKRYISVQVYYLKEDEVAVIVEDISERKATEEQMQYLSTHDQMTQLENRQQLNNYLNNLVFKAEDKPTLILFDINSLTIFNEAYGYEVGDQIIKDVANILANYVTDDIHAYRMDGDGFAIVMMARDIDIDAFIDKIKHEMQEIHHQNISVSIATAYTMCTRQKIIASEFIKKAEKKLTEEKLVEEKSHQNNAVKAILATLTTKYEDERIHSKRVSKFCEIFAEKLGLSDTDTQILKLAGMTHDIGKIAIPDEILHKPAKLNDEEYEIMKTHAEIGYKILDSAKENNRIALTARHHHERYDGRGYPDGLKGEEIPLFSRIISVLDAYEAMTSNRVYRQAMSQSYAISELKKYSGTQFDPKMVEIFLEMLKDMKTNKNTSN